MSLLKQARRILKRSMNEFLKFIHSFFGVKSKEVCRSALFLLNITFSKTVVF